MHPLLDPTRRAVVGHRGNAMHAPENTLASFRQAVSLGVDALELDVHLTADGEVVVIHDPTVDRTTDGTGAVAGMTRRELERLDAGARFTRDGGRTFPYRGHGLRIPTLADVLEAFPDTPLLIELKTAEVGLPTRRVLEQRGATDRCLVASFDRRAVEPFFGSAIAYGAATTDVRALLLPALLGGRFPRLPFRFMSIPSRYRGLRIPVRALARAVAPAGCTVHVWTVNSPVIAKRLWRHGAHAIISDDPKTILEARATLGAG